MVIRMNQEELLESLWNDVELGKLNYSELGQRLQDAWANGHDAAEANLERLNEMASLERGKNGSN